MLGVGEVATAGELVALLAVLASALAVALTGESAIARARAADQAEDECEIDRCRRGVGTIDVLLHAPAGEDVRSPTACQAPGDLPQ